MNTVRKFIVTCNFCIVSTLIGLFNVVSGEDALPMYFMIILTNKPS